MIGIRDRWPFRIGHIRGPLPRSPGRMEAVLQMKELNIDELHAAANNG
jgi:hypothetical protein